MSKKVVLGVLGLIIVLNAFVIGYVLIDRAGDDDSDSDNEQTQEESEETEENEEAEAEQADEESSADEEETGSINGNGGYTENEEELNTSAIEKSKANREKMNEIGKWIATNYAPEDIKTQKYTVQRGDTLWEISEAYHGKGSDWRKILELNKDEVGYLPNGSQALIVPGQILVLK